MIAAGKQGHCSFALHVLFSPAAKKSRFEAHFEGPGGGGRWSRGVPKQLQPRLRVPRCSCATRHQPRAWPQTACTASGMLHNPSAEGFILSVSRTHKHVLGSLTHCRHPFQHACRLCNPQTSAGFDEVGQLQLCWMLRRRCSWLGRAAPPHEEPAHVQSSANIQEQSFG